MSMHKSLKLKNTLVRQRSVLSRWERILKLQDAGRWKEGDSVLGLPKVRTKFKVRSRKAPKAEKPAEGAAAAAPAAGAETTDKKAAPAKKEAAAPAAAAKKEAPAKKEKK
jgi:small basic protein (TIGR04137 family)